MLDEYDYRFELGKAAELRTGRDVVLISTGLMTMRALQAAARLEADHVDVAVLHVPTIKPLDREAILRAARTDRLVVTLENHTVIGGLAESVALDRSPSPGWAPASSRSRCPTSSSPPAPCPPCTTATACRPTRIVAKVKAELAVRRPARRGSPTPLRAADRLPAPQPRPHSRRKPMSVSDKTALVTGAGSKRGIGRATAHTLAAAGWNIAILDLDEASAKDAADEIAERHGVQAVGIGCDVTDETSVENALAVARRTPSPPVGALVNNAGITSPTPFLEVTGEEWDRIFAVNVRGCLQRHPPLAPGMAERGFGRIVFLSSVSAERGGGVFGGVAYSAAKAAQLGFARALARELGPHGRHRQLRRPRPDRHRHHRRRARGRAQDAARRRRSRSAATVGVADVADLITYLCREESGYITGATYDVNGGAAHPLTREAQVVRGRSGTIRSAAFVARDPGSGEPSGSTCQRPRTWSSRPRALVRPAQDRQLLDGRTAA